MLVIDCSSVWICQCHVTHAVTTNTRAVRKVSSRFEYLKNRSRGLDLTWQPVTETLRLMQPEGPEGGPRSDYVASVVAFLGSIIICRLHKLTF
jgi:hypothetical protein